MERLSGDIRDMTVSHLFLRLWQEKRTGMVVFERPRDVKKVYTLDGDICAADSTLEEDRLGECLIRSGIITRQQHDAAAMHVEKTGKKYEAVLIDLGILTYQALVNGLRGQIAHTIITLLGWSSGKYVFEETPLPLNEIVPIRLRSSELLVSCLRRLDWRVVQELLPPQDSILTPAIGWPTVNHDLSPNQREILQLIDGKRCLRDICAFSKAGDFYTLKVIFLFMALGMVEVGDAGACRDIQARPDQASIAVDARFRLVKAYEDMKFQDHYQVLGVEKGASIQDIQAAYLRLARMYHPDRCLEPGMQNTRDVLERLSIKITEAYNMLKDRTTRSEMAYLTNQGRVKPVKKQAAAEKQTDKESDSEIYFKKGMEAYGIGSYSAAAEAFKKASALDPQNARYLYYQGLSFSHIAGRYYEAEEGLSKAVKSDPGNEDYVIDLAALYLKRGLRSRAYGVLKDALERIPDSERIKAAIAGCAVQGGQGRG